MTDTKALQLYPDKEQVDLLTARIRDLIPGANKHSDEVLRAFATIALAHGLDPFIGEVWIIPTKRGPRVRAGIEGHRKAARLQSTYQIEQRQMTGPERDTHGLHDGQVAAVTSIYRTDCRIEGMAFKPAMGYGIWTPGDKRPIPDTKTPLWVAYKRSEQDALRKAFSLPFASERKAFSQSLAVASSALASPGRNGSQPAPPRPEAAGSARAAAAQLYGDWDGEVFAAGEDDPPAEPQAEIIDATATVISDEPQPEDNGTEPNEKPATTRTVNTETGEITEQPAAQTPFPDRNTAIAWGHEQGAFTDPREAHRHYMKLKARKRPIGGAHMSYLWRQYVADCLQAQADGKAEALAS